MIEVGRGRRNRRDRRLAGVSTGMPEIDIQSLDLLDEHRDRPAGGAHLFARIGLKAFSPAPKRLDLLLIEPLQRDAQLAIVTG